MDYRHDLDLTLSGNTFENLKADFDRVLFNTLDNMESKGSYTAEITVKLKIDLIQSMVPDVLNGEQTSRSAIIPQFDHKVRSVMQIKDEAEGSLRGDYELVYDDESGWIMRKINVSIHAPARGAI